VNPTDDPQALLPDGDAGRAIRDAFLADERTMLAALAAQISRGDEDVHDVEVQARAWVEAVRADRETQGGIESFLQQ
jgi:hypothetical protein